MLILCWQMMARASTRRSPRRHHFARLAHHLVAHLTMPRTSRVARITAALLATPHLILLYCILIPLADLINLKDMHEPSIRELYLMHRTGKRNDRDSFGRCSSNNIRLVKLLLATACTVLLLVICTFNTHVLHSRLILYSTLSTMLSLCCLFRTRTVQIPQSRLPPARVRRAKRIVGRGVRCVRCVFVLA